MILGIVGSESAKFTDTTEWLARETIRRLILSNDVTRVVSGKCHLGGIDIWAIEEAIKLSIEVQEFPAENLNWEYGYKPRNMCIAQASDKIVCITVRELPSNYKGMRFPYCYHCDTDKHVKSGGCWTVKYAKKLGKQTEIIVIE